jgi:hypothetical protein
MCVNTTVEIAYGRGYQVSNHCTDDWLVPGLLVLGFGVLIWPADTQASKAVLGSLTVAVGQVQVDKVVGLPGTALMEGDVVATGSKSDAIIDFRSGAKVTVAESSEVALLYDTSAGIDLRQGAVALQTGSGQVSQVNTNFATSVVSRSEDGFPALCRVSAIGSEVGVLNEKGRVEIHGAGTPFLLPAGKYVVLRAGPQAGSAAAGKVTAAIPREVVDRQGAAALPLKLSDPVYWQDLVRTEQTGRVRIELTGGSILNVGARSEMRIIKHDPASEQTELEMKVGRMREQVMKLTKPGASFQTKTQTAVIGVVGTDIIIVSTATYTTVICLSGTVAVTASNPTYPGSATLQPDQTTTVPINGPPTAPVYVSPATLQSELAQFSTNIAGAATQGVGIMTITDAVISGAGIGVLGVTVVRLGNAANLLNQAGSSAGSAAGSLTNAGGVLGNIPGGWPPVGCGLQTFQQENSSSSPISGICPP